MQALCLKNPSDVPIDTPAPARSLQHLKGCLEGLILRGPEDYDFLTGEGDMGYTFEGFELLKSVDVRVCHVDGPGWCRMCGIVPVYPRFSSIRLIHFIYPR